MRNEASALAERKVNTYARATAVGPDFIDGDVGPVLWHDCVWEGEDVAAALRYVEEEFACHFAEEGLGGVGGPSEGHGGMMLCWSWHTCRRCWIMVERARTGEQLSLDKEGWKVMLVVREDARRCVLAACSVVHTVAIAALACVLPLTDPPVSNG